METNLRRFFKKVGISRFSMAFFGIYVTIFYASERAVANGFSYYYKYAILIKCQAEIGSF